MTRPQAVIFDLGGTLVEWPDDDPAPRWALTYQHLMATQPDTDWPGPDAFVRAMVEAEGEHWARVVAEQWSGPPSGLVREGFRRLNRIPSETQILAVLDGYRQVTEGFSIVCSDAIETLGQLREQGYRLGLLSNTWWAADWHDAELAAHGLADLLDEVAYTSDLPHSKPHPSVFREVSNRLGVDPAACVMVGDRPIDDVAGALGAGMRAILKRTNRVYPTREDVVPTATITHLTQIPELLRAWRADDGTSGDP